MTGVPVFFCEPTDQVVVRLRVYESGEGLPPCSNSSYHNAFSEAVAELTEPAEATVSVNGPAAEYAGDPRWPERCACGHLFTPSATRESFRRRLIRRTDTGETFEGYAKLPAGAVWNAFWMADRDRWVGSDGRSLVCKLPDGHDWMIDSQASNCTMPDDKSHKCWVRHGRPEDGTLHVDKSGHTCAAGAGSIATPGYHGFLHHGRLVQC